MLMDKQEKIGRLNEIIAINLITVGVTTAGMVLCILSMHISNIIHPFFIFGIAFCGGISIIAIIKTISPYRERKQLQRMQNKKK